MFEPDQYEHFSFDLWMTLIRSHPEFKPKRDQLFRDFFEIGQPMKKVRQSIRYYDLLSNQMSERSGLHIYAAHIYCLILQDLGKDLNHVEESKLDAFQAASSELFLDYAPQLINPQLLDMMQVIQKEGKTMNILSNTAFIPGSVLRKVLDRHGIGQQFTFQLYSDETGLSKPNKKIFEQVIKTAQQIKPLRPEQVLHIGDNAVADIKGAQSAGLQAYLVLN